MCAKLALLWHMHQPCYRDPLTGRYVMPWVFLHAAKDYKEMLSLALESGARVTFNFVPVLLDQLEDYGDPAVADDFLELMRRDPDALGDEERSRLAGQLSMLHEKNQAARYKRLHDLLARLNAPHRTGEGVAPWFSRGDWLDFQVLYLLAWTGELTREQSELMRGLAARGAHFTQEEKLALLDELHALCRDTAAAFREAEAAGHIEISSSPYCHPILPLLMDVESARAAVPDIPLPEVAKGVFGADASRQVGEAVARHEEVFGGKPRGFWPSEGSVSDEALQLLASNGVRWAGTDEDILAASLGRALGGGERRALYTPHRFECEGGPINLFFRDKALSDLIGFVYSSWPEHEAAVDFVGRLRSIVRAHGPDSVITVILDGENAWEHYAENGAPFLRELYRAVAGCGEVEFATFSEIVDSEAARPTLGHVRPGSWIYGSFTTWIGHPEKNAAWEALALARARLNEVSGGLDAEAARRAWSHLRVAEGSDWFWWLGDDHYTPLAGRFDELFRANLTAVYRAIGEEVPGRLRIPIKRVGRRGVVAPPQDYIFPKVNGITGSFFEYHDAGRFDLGYDAGSMHRTDRVFEELLYGTDGDRLYLCVKGDRLDAALHDGEELVVLAGGDEREVLRLRAGQDEVPGECSGECPGEPCGIWRSVAEIALPLAGIERDEGGRVAVAFKLLCGAELIERAPMFHMAELIAEPDHGTSGWSV